MHRTGHWLGMDVHDVGDYKLGDQWRVLEPGMALTIEPGIYIPAGIKGVPRRFDNIGIRIEDDVVVTRDGVEVLTAAAPQGSGRHRGADGRGLVEEFDIAIIGGGMVGASLALALAQAGRRIVLIEGVAPDSAPTKLR